jgi:protease IV
MNIRFLWILLIVALVTATGCSLPQINLFPQEGPLKEVVLEGTGQEKVLVLSIDGPISDKPKEGVLKYRPGMVQEFISHLKSAEKDPKIKAVLLKVNSPGGPVTASDILYHEISAYKERSGVKLVVSMMDVAASGGYYLSLPADWIMAHPTTVTGSVGVIFMRPGVSGFMEKFGFAMNVSKSGDQKDMGSPFRASNAADEAIFQELTDQMAGRFYDLVQEHRQLSPEQMRKVTTARIFLAPDAKKMGLVDEVGYLKDALAKAKSLAGLGADAKVVTFQRNESQEVHIYSASLQTGGAGPNLAVPSLSGMVGLPETGFYYIWPAVVSEP